MWLLETYEADIFVLSVYPRWDFDAFDKFAAKTGEKATIECALHAVPDPEFSWQDHNGVDMPSSSADYIITSEGTISRVEFYSVKQSTYGSYVCRAENLMGVMKFNVHLNEPGN